MTKKLRIFALALTCSLAALGAQAQDAAGAAATATTAAPAATTAARSATTVAAAVTPSTTPQSAGEKVSGWFDKLSDSFKTFGEKGSQWAQDAQGYTDQLKAQWPGIKEKFNQGWEEGLKRGQEGKEALTKWMNETFSEERMDKAEKWLTDFKNGVEDKVVDPLVPYVLSLRYPNPLEEWNQGYKKLYPVQISGLERPLEITLPLSWNLSQDLSLGQNEFMSWSSDSGSGKYAVALITTPEGATVESIVAGLQKNRPGAVTEKLADTQIVRIAYPALNDTDNAVYYYALPAGGKAFLIAGEVLRQKDQTTQNLNESLAAQAEFFNTVAKNVFVKPEV